MKEPQARPSGRGRVLLFLGDSMALDGKTIGKGGFMVVLWWFNGGLMGFYWVSPLVNSNKKLETDPPPFVIGKLIISTGPFSIAILNYRRRYIDMGLYIVGKNIAHGSMYCYILHEIFYI